MESVKSFLSGGIGGMCVVIVGHPLDTVKVRLMTDSKGEYKGTVDCLKKIYSHHGFKGFFSGMSAPLLSISPAYAVYFWGFDVGRRIAARYQGCEVKDISLLGVVFAGAVSAVPGSLFLVPFDLLKVKLQVEMKKPKVDRLFTGPASCLSHILRVDGLPGLYKGTGAMLLREIPSTMAYYTTYEVLKKNLTQKSEQSSVFVIVTAGGFAGMANWLVAVPPDVLKSRLQSGKYPGGLKQIFWELFREDGPKAFFKGLTPALLRAFPANGACFLGMETSRKVLDKYF